MPKLSNSNQNAYIISKEIPNNPVTHAYEAFVSNLIYANIDQKYHILSFIPTMKKGVHANLVVNVGYQLTLKKKHVLIVDFDFRMPQLASCLVNPKPYGIYDYLFKNQEINKMIQKDQSLGFDYLLVGQTINSITQVLESDKLKEMMEHLKPMYDYILLISPSMALSKDGLLISKLSDGIIYIVSKKHSHKQDVDVNLFQLKKQSIPILGSLLIDYQEKERLLGIPLL